MFRLLRSKLFECVDTYDPRLYCQLPRKIGAIFDTEIFFVVSHQPVGNYLLILVQLRRYLSKELLRIDDKSLLPID